MAPAAARAANDAKRKQKEDLNEAVGLWSFGKNIINIFITIITLVVVIICLNFTIFNICGTSTTLCEFLREHRSTHNPVSSGHSNRPVVDLSPTYNFRECAYVCARPRVHQGLKGGFNVHIIRQKKGGSGKRPKWIGEPWLKVLFSYVYKKFGHQRGHLVPFADMNSPEDKELTNELENNIVPIHKNVNMRNMSAVEKYYRKLAKKGELVEYTGWLGELPLGGMEEFEEYIRAGGRMNKKKREKLEKTKKHVEAFDGRISASKYLFKSVWRKDTYEFVCCAVISNDVQQAPDDPTLPKGGPPPEGMEKVDWEDATRGRTIWMTGEEELYKWCGEQFPDYLTPQKCIDDARMLKTYSLSVHLFTCSSIIFVCLFYAMLSTRRRNQAKLQAPKVCETGC